MSDLPTIELTVGDSPEDVAAILHTAPNSSYEGHGPTPFEAIREAFRLAGELPDDEDQHDPVGEL